MARNWFEVTLINRYIKQTLAYACESIPNTRLMLLAVSCSGLANTPTSTYTHTHSIHTQHCNIWLEWLCTWILALVTYRRYSPHLLASSISAQQICSTLQSLTWMNLQHGADLLGRYGWRKKMRGVSAISN